MTAEDIIKLAREQGLPETEVEGVFRVNSDDLGRLLAAQRQKIVEQNAPAINSINHYIRGLEALVKPYRTQTTSLEMDFD